MKFGRVQYLGVVVLLVAIGGTVGWNKMAGKMPNQFYTVEFSRGTNVVDDSPLRQVAADLKENPDATVLVIGHTGTRGDPEANYNLSDHRAQFAVREMIQFGKNLDPARFEAIGRGGDEPLECGDTESERVCERKNARVEITVRY